MRSSDRHCSATGLLCVINLPCPIGEPCKLIAAGAKFAAIPKHETKHETS